MTGFWRAAAELQESGTPFVVVTAVGARGSIPQEVGAKAIVTKDGIFQGTVGGGKVEARAIVEAKRRLEESVFEPALVTWNLQTDIGMTCGGEIRYLFETHGTSEWRIVVFGAGHVGQALTKVLAALDCDVTCVDSRAEWLGKLPRKIRALRLDEPASHVASMKGDEFVVVTTQGHATDVPILEALFHRYPGIPYVGSIGSDLKAAKMRRELTARNVGGDFLEKLKCPIGLPFGGNDPGEIAISIAAQLLQARDEPATRG